MSDRWRNSFDPKTPVTHTIPSLSGGSEKDTLYQAIRVGAEMQLWPPEGNQVHVCGWDRDTFPTHWCVAGVPQPSLLLFLGT